MSSRRRISIEARDVYSRGVASLSLCCQCGDGVEAQSWSCCCSSAFAGILPQEMCFHMSPQFHFFLLHHLQNSGQSYMSYSAAKKERYKCCSGGL